MGTATSGAAAGLAVAVGPDASLCLGVCLQISEDAPVPSANRPAPSQWLARVRFESFGGGAVRASRVLADLATAVPRMDATEFSPTLVPALSVKRGPGTLSSPRSRTVFDLPDSARYDIRLLRV